MLYTCVVTWIFFVGGNAQLTTDGDAREMKTWTVKSLGNLVHQQLPIFLRKIIHDSERMKDKINRHCLYSLIRQHVLLKSIRYIKDNYCLIILNIKIKAFLFVYTIGSPFDSLIKIWSNGQTEYFQKGVRSNGQIKYSASAVWCTKIDSQ